MAKKVILKDSGVQIFPHTTISAVDGKATDKQIEDGTDNTNYTTPQSVKYAIDVHAMEAIRAHTEDKNNPHEVTAEQTGAYHPGNANRPDIDWSCDNLFANSSVIAKQDVVAYSEMNNVRIEPTQSGVINLWEIADVELPNDIGDNQVLTYDRINQVWKAKSVLGIDNQPISYNKLKDVPTAFTPCAHNHIGNTYNLSDERLKCDIEDINNPMAIINQLNPKSYNWTDEASELGLKGKGWGLIAQDVKQLLPEIVKPIGHKDYIGVDYVSLIPVLIQAVKDQQVMILSLSKKLNQLEKRK